MRTPRFLISRFRGELYCKRKECCVEYSALCCELYGQSAPLRRCRRSIPGLPVHSCQSDSDSSRAPRLGKPHADEPVPLAWTVLARTHRVAPYVLHTTG